MIVMLGDPPSAAGVQYTATSGEWTIEEGDGPFVVYGENGSGKLIGRFTGSVSTTTIQNAAGACGCGTQYARGSQSVTINSVAYEHATTYTITPVCATGTWEFPEATYDTGSDWVTGAETLIACGSAGTLDGELTLTPCGYRDVCGVTILTAKIVLATTADGCSVDDDPAAVWICDNWNPLGPMNTFALVEHTVDGFATWSPPPILCVSPKYITTVCNTFNYPSQMYVDFGGAAVSSVGLGCTACTLTNLYLDVADIGSGVCLSADTNCYNGSSSPYQITCSVASSGAGTEFVATVEIATINATYSGTRNLGVFDSGAVSEQEAIDNIAGTYTLSYSGLFPSGCSGFDVILEVRV